MKLWLEALRKEVGRSSQAKVAKLLGVSPATVSLVLAEKYPGDVDRIARKVEGLLMKISVHCPVLGEITQDICEQHQCRPFAATNPQRIKLYRACRSGCPHSHLEERMGSPLNIQVIDDKPTLTTRRPGERCDANALIHQMERQAAEQGTDKYQLLKGEFIALAVKYNRLLTKESK
ncbi:hypothetical protein [Ferrimonas sp.]|uniref:hypothetical protein n=1 Tax=Ferrimonas sp. TaxID=2080861 RepID=UPI003A8EF9A4